MVPAPVAITSVISQNHETQRLHVLDTPIIQSSPQPFISVGASLDTYVPQAVKDKSTKGENLDLSTLLQPCIRALEAEQHKFLIKAGQLSTVPNIHKPNKITFIEKWTDAMLVLTLINISCYIDQAQHLLKKH